MYNFDRQFFEERSMDPTAWFVLSAKLCRIWYDFAIFSLCYPEAQRRLLNRGWPQAAANDEQMKE